MADLFRSLPFWRLTPNYTALTISDPSLILATLFEADRATGLGYICTSLSGTRIAPASASTRLPDGRYELKFIVPADLSAIRTQILESLGLRRQVPVELPGFEDDLVVVIRRIQESAHTVIPGTG
jgi:hypothetical protein